MNSASCQESGPSAEAQRLTRIFVYGTLKRGQPNHGHLRGQRFVSAASTRPEYRLHDLGGYPGMVRAEQHGVSVEGEVWDVDEACLHDLDVVEDITGGEYERTHITLLAPFDDGSVEGYVCLCGVDGLPDAGNVW